jgi:hypothetical protein
MWTESHRTLKLNSNAAPSKGWKSLLEFTSAINLELQSIGLDPNVTDDERLEHEIEQLLQGGSISSPQLTEGYFSTWRWMWKHKWHLLALVSFTVFMIVEHVFRFYGLYSDQFYPGHETYPEYIVGIVFSILYGTLCLILSLVIGTCNLEMIITFLILEGLCIPFLFYDAIERDMVLPGVFIGLGLALFLGSTRGSQTVIFSVLISCNYVAVLIFFINEATSPSPYHVRYSR